MSDKIIENNQVTIMGEIGKGEASEQLGRPDSTDDFGASD